MLWIMWPGRRWEYIRQNLAYIQAYIYINVCVCVCVCVCARARFFVCVHVYVYACVCVFASVSKIPSTKYFRTSTCIYLAKYLIRGGIYIFVVCEERLFPRGPSFGVCFMHIAMNKQPCDFREKRIFNFTFFETPIIFSRLRESVFSRLPL